MKISRLALVIILFMVLLVLCTMVYLYSSASNLIQPLLMRSGRPTAGFVNSTQLNLNNYDSHSNSNDDSKLYQIVNRTLDYTLVSQTASVSHQSLSRHPMNVDVVTKTSNHLSNSNLPLFMQSVGDKCHLSESTLRNWKRGLITELAPRIKKDCHKLRFSDKEEKLHVRQEMENWNSLESEQQWLTRLTGNCSNVIREFEQSSFYISEEELNFPIAYIFVIYTKPRQIVRLLKAIYRPQNIYCIHPDARQGEEFASLFRHISKCIPNIFVASKLEKVYYLHHSLMDAQMNCMRDLLQFEPTKWKYVINICGRELPLKTNREVVESLSRQKGNTLLGDVALVSKHGNTMKNRFTWKVSLNPTTEHLMYTNQKLPSPPHNIKIYKSFTFLAATREFVQFILNDPVARDFHEFMKGVKIPEEHFYASLYRYVAHIPMSNVTVKSSTAGTPRVEQILWLDNRNRKRCEGIHVHKICIVTSADLDLVFSLGVENKRTHFFFNKYFMEKDHVVMDCLEEHLLKQNKLEHGRDCHKR